MNFDFDIINKGNYSSFLDSQNIFTFQELIHFVRNLPYGRNSKRDDFTSLFIDKKGTCSTKHGLLMEICELNNKNEVELMLGIFLMNDAYSQKIKPILDKYDLKSIPEAHSYLRFEGQRFDYTSSNADVNKFEAFLVREQRCDSHQVFEWKPMIHKHFIGGWKERNKIQYTEEKIWEIREECIVALSN